MSSDSSSTHPAFTRGVPDAGSTCSKHAPVWVSEVHVNSWGSPYWELKVLRSDSALGSWKASRMAMIWPAPAPEVGVRPDRLYTDWMAAGDRPVGVVFVIFGLPSGSLPPP
jgi:hypothetical protein